MSFNTLGLSAALLRAVSEQGYSEPTPVQRQAIPVILKGRDIMAGAQTGTGKTAGFTLPLLQLLSTSAHKDSGRPIRALILVPTRELAAQIQESVHAYGKHLPLKSTVVYGGMNIKPQIDRLRKGVDILVATPGRLLDHAGQRTVNLSLVEILILDEADRMLDMGFIRDIRRIISQLPAQRQTLMFSATFSDEIKKLAGDILKSPVTIQVARHNTAAAGVSHVIHPVDHSRKRELLTHLIESGNWQQVLVFTSKKHGAHRLAQQLNKSGITATAIHGDKSQSQRTRALEDFKRNKVQVLVGTNVASRGLDIDQLPHVVNYELPDVPEDYIHRIGRTGRAGKEGKAVSLVAANEMGLLKDIERLLQRDLPRIIVPGYEPDPRIQVLPQQNKGNTSPRGDYYSGPRRGNNTFRGKRNANAGRPRAYQ